MILISTKLILKNFFRTLLQKKQIEHDRISKFRALGKYHLSLTIAKQSKAPVIKHLMIPFIGYSFSSVHKLKTTISHQIKKETQFKITVIKIRFVLSLNFKKGVKKVKFSVEI